MAKEIGHFNISVFLRRDSAIQASLMALAAPSVLLSLNNYYGLSLWHSLPSATAERQAAQRISMICEGKRRHNGF